jgi:hypothetical protein
MKAAKSVVSGVVRCDVELLHTDLARDLVVDLARDLAGNVARVFAGVGIESSYGVTGAPMIPVIARSASAYLLRSSGIADGS